MTAIDEGRVRVTARAVAVLYLYRAVAGFVLGYPLARTLGALGATALPDGDLAFFAPGGLHLLEALRLGVRLIPASLESATFVSVLLGIVGLFPLAVALADLLDPAGTRRDHFGVAADRAPTLLFLSGATILGQAGIAIITALAVTAASTITDSLRDERTADLVPLVVGLGGLVAVAAVGVLQDVARAAAMRHGARGLDAVRVAGRTLVATPRAVVRGFLGPMVGTVLVVIGAATLTSFIDVSRPGAWRVACVSVEHQLAIVAIIALRLRALGTTLALVGPHALLRDRFENDTPASAVLTD